VRFRFTLFDCRESGGKDKRNVIWVFWFFKFLVPKDGKFVID
jgi:hypothetical protein